MKDAFYKISFILASALLLILSTALIIHVINPDYYTEVGTWKDPVTGYKYLFIGYEFGPFDEIYFNLEKITPYTYVGLDTYYYSPDRKIVAYETIELDSKSLLGDVQKIKILDLLTLRRKTIISSARWSNFYWKDSKTIRFFMPHGNDIGFYRDVDIKTPTPFVFNDKIDYGEDMSSWTKASSEEIAIIQKELMKINTN